MEALYQLSYSPVCRRRRAYQRMARDRTPTWHADGTMSRPFSASSEAPSDLPSNLPSDMPPGLLPDALDSAERVAHGHIHQTWRVTDSAGGEWAVQRISTTVFDDPDALATNLRRVTDAARKAGVPTLIPVAVGPQELPILRYEDGVWRASRWIEGRRMQPSDLGDSRVAAAAFGAFDAAVSDVSGLVEVLPHFHDPLMRFDRLGVAVSTDRLGRAAPAMDLVSRLEQIRAARSEELSAWNRLPIRVAHNDAKATNVLMDTEGRAVVIDLDTVMSGTVLADIGELVRSTVRPVEDQITDTVVDPGLVGEIVGAFTRAFGSLTSDETALLGDAGLILTTENAVRFLTDHLEGDIYFTVDDPDHNFRRAEAQTALAESLVGASVEIADAVAMALGP